MQDIIRPGDDEVEDNFLYYGLEKVGFSREQVQQTNRDTSMKRFTSFFGCCSRTSKVLFAALKESKSFRCKPSLLYFFMCLTWLKTYSTKRVIAGMFQVHENTVRTWVWKYAKGIQSLKERKVRHCLYSFLLLSLLLNSSFYRNLSTDFIRSGNAGTKCLSILSRQHSLSN